MFCFSEDGYGLGGGVGRGLGVGVDLSVGVAVAVAVAVAVGVGDGVAPTRLNAPILNCHPAPLVVGTYSLMYQKVVSSVGSITIDV